MIKRSGETQVTEVQTVGSSGVKEAAVKRSFSQMTSVCTKQQMCPQTHAPDVSRNGRTRRKTLVPVCFGLLAFVSARPEEERPARNRHDDRSNCSQPESKCVVWL